MCDVKSTDASNAKLLPASALLPLIFVLFASPEDTLPLHRTEAAFHTYSRASP